MDRTRRFVGVVTLLVRERTPAALGMGALGKGSRRRGLHHLLLALTVALHLVPQRTSQAKPPDASAGARIEEIASICAQDPGGRGIGPLARDTRKHLYQAASSIADHPAPKVAILTGFFIPQAKPPAAETDGPVGSSHLAAGLINAGIDTVVVTDEPCAGTVKAALRAASMVIGKDIPLEVVAFSRDRSPQAVAFTIRSLEDIAGRLRSRGITHIVALERVARSHDGRPHNMRGDDISAFTAPLDVIFDSPGAPWMNRRIGVGDGGNEIGMGFFEPRKIEKAIQKGKVIPAKTAADSLLVCGTSNWGGPALLLAVAILKPQLRARLTATLTPRADFDILYRTVHEGHAVDGITLQNRLSVDGLPWAVHKTVLEQMLRVAGGSCGTTR